MKRAVRDHPLGIRDKLRNKRIARKRSAGERPYTVIKNMFKSGHLLVTATLRTHSKNLFTCFCYNLLQFNTLQKKYHLANANTNNRQNKGKNKKNANIIPKKIKKLKISKNFLKPQIHK